MCIRDRADDVVLLARTQVVAAGSVSDVLRDDLLSAAYGCAVRTNQTPQGNRPFVLPPAVFGASHAPASQIAPNGAATHVLAS